MTDVREFAMASMDAWNRRDADAFAAFYAPDAELHEHSSGVTLVGGPEVAAHNLAWTQSFSDLAATVERSFHDAAMAGWQLVWHGTHDGPLPLRNGEVAPPTGRTVEVPAVLMTEWRDGRIARQDHYFNAVTMLTQLGILPAPEAAVA